MRVFLIFFISQLSFAQQNVGKEAISHSKTSGVKSSHGAKEKVLSLMKYFSNSPLHQNAAPTPNDPNTPPPLLKGGVHPYEWDSIRTSEEMLKTCEGGSCGTIALSGAAILRAGGISTEDIRVIGGVLNHDYMSLCPGEKGKNRNDGKRNGTSGHVYIQVKIEGKWYLLNTTHNPLMDPINEKSVAVTTYRALMDDCRRRFPIEGKPDPKTKMGRKFISCSSEARQAGLDRIKFEDLEITPFLSPEEVESEMKEGPVSIPVEKFPSLVKWMGQGTVPEMIVFKSWKFEDYPVHTFKDRLNYVASGSREESKCRYSFSSVNKITKYPRKPQSGRSRPSVPKKGSATKAI